MFLTWKENYSSSMRKQKQWHGPGTSRVGNSPLCTASLGSTCTVHLRDCCSDIQLRIVATRWNSLSKISLTNNLLYLYHDDSLLGLPFGIVFVCTFILSREFVKNKCVTQKERCLITMHVPITVSYLRSRDPVYSGPVRHQYWTITPKGNSAAALWWILLN